jgi:hypothetical protein
MCPISGSLSCSVQCRNSCASFVPAHTPRHHCSLSASATEGVTLASDYLTREEAEAKFRKKSKKKGKKKKGKKRGKLVDLSGLEPVSLSLAGADHGSRSSRRAAEDDKPSESKARAAAYDAAVARANAMSKVQSALVGVRLACNVLMVFPIRWTSLVGTTFFHYCLSPPLYILQALLEDVDEVDNDYAEALVRARRVAGSKASHRSRVADRLKAAKVCSPIPFIVIFALPFDLSFVHSS